uniref:Uncharacterized protein n=1 Tax=Arundo donax TaxID=35708 RepID=A0A0A9ABK4_ARUDO
MVNGCQHSMTLMQRLLPSTGYHLSLPTKHEK